MTITRETLINEARKYVGCKFRHQGRNPEYGFDCGGLVLITAQNLQLSQLEELGYALFPNNGRFEQLLNENAVDIGFEGKGYNLTGTEFQPGDLLSFDYGIGEGTRHIAIVSKWDSRCYWVIEAHNLYGVCEHPLRPPFFNQKTTIKAWGIPGIIDSKVNL